MNGNNRKSVQREEEKMEVLKLEEKKRVEKVQKERKDTAVQTRHLRMRGGAVLQWQPHQTL